MSSRRERTQKPEQGQEREQEREQEQEEVRQLGRQRQRAVCQEPGARSVRPAASASGHPGGQTVAPGARQWLTLVGRKRVLAVVHTVTYAKRLLEVLSLLAADFRVQVVFTTPPHAFGSEVPRFLAELNSAVIPWEDVRHQSFDLALAAGPQGLAHVRAPLIALPHGANYLKRIVGPSDGPEAGVAGLRRSDIMPDGRELPAALVVPHTDELAALARSCPEALAVTEVVGDPAHDRIAAGLSRRIAYRQALGIHDGQKLVVVASTWGPRSSFGRIEALLPRLIGELPGGPGGTFRTAVLVHPNVWSGHGAWQMRAWLTQFGRYGISVLPPEADWRSVLIAADWIIGDHGSVTLYGTLTPAPILLTGSGDEEINPASPAATLALTAPVLSPAPPLVDQLAYAASEYDREEYAAIAARITSEPGRFHRNMRRLMYRVLGLGRPAYEPGTELLPLPPPLSAWTELPSGGAGQEPA